MQDPSLYAQINPIFPEQEHLKCPRCDSPNTKFCYYNNYNLSQPRFFCKSCKRYWTKGGSLRNIPVGSASRKNTKRSSTTKKPSSSSSSSSPPPPPPSSKAASTPSASSTTSTSSAAAAAAASSSSPKAKAFETGGAALDQGRPMLGNFGTLFGYSNQGQFGHLTNGQSQNGSDLQLGEFSNGHVHNPGSGLGLGTGLTRNVEPRVGLQNGDEDSSSRWNGGNGWPDLSIYPPGSSYQ